MQLKDGTVVDDPRLDRLVSFDERSRSYPVRTLLGAAQPRSYTWPLDIVLDQGSEGACVGFAVAHELRAVPAKVPVLDNADARKLYHRAQQIDEWPGGAYAGASPFYEGTSVLAGIKAAQELGHLSEYRWAFNVDELATAVSRTGPAIIGINWHWDMYTPVRRDEWPVPHSPFWIRPTGPIVGGHAILVRGFNVRADAFCLHNSWGRGWGANGLAWISRTDLGNLLAANGEACIPVKR